MKLSVIIATFNRRNTLIETLPHILNQDLPAEDYEVVIAVDGSSDGTVDMLRSISPRCSLRVIEQPHRGQAFARNNAAVIASGPLFLFLDDDLICEKSLVRSHADVHQEPNIGITHGPILLCSQNAQSFAGLARKRNFEIRHLQFTGDLRKSVGHFHQTNFCIKRDLFLSLGGFDPHLSVSEDTELGIRLLKEKINCSYIPNAIVRELYFKSTRTYIASDAVSYGSSEVYLCRKHPDRRAGSDLNNLGASSLTRRLMRRVACYSPLSLQLSLVPLWILERLSWIETCRRIGLSLFGLCQRLAFLSGAVRAVGSYNALKATYAMRLPVLLYHNVGPATRQRFPHLTISAERFERQIRWLRARGYTPIRSRDWIAWVSDGAPLPHKPVLLTFDDGYANLASHAFPVLRRYGFTAEVFVATSLVGGTNVWDHDGGTGTHRLLDTDDIARWSQQGLRFCSHSRTHADLTTITAASLADEVDRSAQDIAALTNGSPISFAYPYGSFNDAVRKRVSATFGCAYTAEPGLNDLSVDLFALRRIVVPHDRSLADFGCRVALGWSPIAELRSLLRLRSRAKKVLTVLGMRR